MLFTAETAKQAAANSAIARQSNRNSELAKLALADEIIAKAALNSVQANVPAPIQDDFVQRRIARTRTQIERLCRLLDEEEDPQACDRFAAAIGRLSTLEREYAMRPAPGTLKPTAAPKPSREKPAPVTLPPVDPSPPGQTH